MSLYWWVTINLNEIIGGDMFSCLAIKLHSLLSVRLDYTFNKVIKESLRVRVSHMEHNRLYIILPLTCYISHDGIVHILIHPNVSFAPRV